MSKRILVLGLLAILSATSTGCFPRVRQVIANRWHMHHGYGGGACCTPAFKVPAQAASYGQPGCCGSEGAGAPIIYGGPTIQHGPAIPYGPGTPTIGAPMPLLGSGSIPGPMPGKTN